MNILFLDIDGVLNDHGKLPGSKLCGIDLKCMQHLNYIITKTDCKIVISSSWRYLILSQQMTLKGFQYLLATHGLICPDEGDILIGHLPLDCEKLGANRGEQIQTWLKENRLENNVRFAIVDDCPDGMSMEPMDQHFIKTDGNIGLTFDLAEKIIQLLIVPEKSDKSF